MDTVSLYYEERGSGTPVVLLHGFPLDLSLIHISEPTRPY